MKKLYASEAFTCDEINDLLLAAKNMEESVMGELTEDEYNEVVIKYHNLIRKYLGIGNKLFSLGRLIEDKNKIVVIVFDKEANGKSYYIYKDETGVPYTLVEDEDDKMFKVGDKVFVSNPDKEYEKTEHKREHKSFFGEVIEVEEHPGFYSVGVKFPCVPGGYEIEWWYKDDELSLASELDNMTLEEVKNKYGVEIMASYL